MFCFSNIQLPLHALAACHIEVPFVALTATVMKKTTKQLLEFESAKEISESPNKQNVRYSVQKLDASLPVLENFPCLIKELMEKGKNCTRTVIYCQTVKQCSHLFRMFELELGASLYAGVRNPRKSISGYDALWNPIKCQG